MSVFYDFQTAYYMLAMYKDTGILSQEEMLILENTYSSTYAQGIMKADSEVTLKLFLKTFALLTYLDVNLDPESSDTIRNPEKNIEDLKNNLVKLNKLRTDFYKILYRKNLKCGTAISPDGYVINETAR